MTNHIDKFEFDKKIKIVREDGEIESIWIEVEATVWGYEQEKDLSIPPHFEITYSLGGSSEEFAFQFLTDRDFDRAQEIAVERLQEENKRKAEGWL